MLLVGHGATLDAATRQLSGKPIRDPKDMMTLIRSVPYCGLVVAEQSSESDNGNKWSIITVPRLTYRHSGVQDFDAPKVLLAGM